MRPETFKFARLLRQQHHLVDQADDDRRIAPRVVATQQITTQAIGHKSLCRLKHLRFCPAKAVNALLGVAHQEHARRVASARIAGQPSAQGLPLQRIRVLKLIDQQVAHAGIQPLLHPAAKHVIGHQRQCRTLQIPHVDPAAFAFELGVFHDQQAGQPRHALLVQPGLVLGLSGQHLQYQVLRLAHGLYAGDLVAELARCSGLGEQRILHSSRI